MAIVELDSGASRRPRRGDRALIAGLSGAIAALSLAFWVSAPHPAPAAASFAPSASVASGANATAVPIFPRLPPVPGVPPQAASVSGLGQSTTIYGRSGIDRALALPAGTTGVDLFLLPDRLTNENLIWTIRRVVRIRGGVGLASVEGPAIVTWTEKGFQYWIVSPTRTTDELIKLADDLR